MSDQLPERIIDAGVSWWRLDLREFWQHRELLMVFIRRNISTRYRQMLLGVLWSVLEPLALLLMMTAVFGFFLRAPSDGYPYPVFAFAALIPWLLFSKAAMSAAGSLLDNMGLISKIYFPRLILPVSAVARDMYDAIITLLILVVLAAAFGFWPTWKLLLLPVVVVAATIVALGIGLWLAAVMVRFRDLRPLLTIVLQLGFYASPILYSPTVVPERILPFYQLNPMYWLIELSRWIMLGRSIAITDSLYISAALTLLLLLSGIFVFTFNERATVDVQ